MMQTPQSEPFGFLPVELNVVSGNVEISTGANLSETVNEVMAESAVNDGWLYAPRARQYVMGHGMYELPYPSRVFGLPKTHVITYRSPAGEDHIAFLLWALSFFLGFRLSATEAGFLDATPIERNKVVDFLPPPTEAVLELAGTFWEANQATPRRMLRVGGVIHALFLAQNPRLLQFESFLLLYTALDACFALVKERRNLRSTPPQSHVQRIEWMCNEFSMRVPNWAKSQGRVNVLSELRNNAIHEALYTDQPLGFSLHGAGSSQNLPLELCNLVSRLLVAILGQHNATYVCTPLDTRQIYSLDFV